MGIILVQTLNRLWGGKFRRLRRGYIRVCSAYFVKFLFSDEVGKGSNVKKATKPLDEKDRDDIWTDFLKETKVVVISQAFT